MAVAPQALARRTARTAHNGHVHIVCGRQMNAMIKWREKRDRNNESVRKAREKARDEQQRRDAELQELRDENTALRNENASLHEQVVFLQELNKARQ